MLNRFKYFIVFGFLLSAFQNCSNDQGYRSRQYVSGKASVVPIVVADQNTSDGDGDFDSTGNSVLDIADGSQLDPQSCFLDYITVFEWKNSNANLMNEKPILGSSKIKSIILGQDRFRSSPIYSGWSVEGIIQPSTDGSTKMSIQFLKGNPAAPDILDCYIMRVNNQADRDKGLANTFFQNIGVDRNANILVGFLRYKEQFVACRVSSGQGDTVFSGNVDSELLLTSKSAFVIKRGCF